MVAYRSEIDGLRAIAVVPVILFHAGFGLFGGGYAGVDVFFVISGYLITSLVVGELDRGEFSLLRFYERRARRILPALFVMLIVCIPFAWMWMIPDVLKKFSYAVSAVAVFVSNFHFMDDSGYFAFSNEIKPLFHTWSLAVEEQYYIAMPLITIVLWRFGFRVTVIFAGLIALASLALCIYLVRPKPHWAFYLPFTRIWELQVGALCALYLMKRRLPGNDVMAAIGLMLVTGSFIAFGKNTPFPSEYTIAPVAGAALLILFAAPGTRVARLLSHPVLMGIGLISYSAYLWHQPLFAFARIRSIGDPGQGLMLALSVAALGLGYLSWRFIERPFRLPAGAARPRSLRLPVAAAAIALVLAAGGVYGHSKEGFPGRLQRNGDEALSGLLKKGPRVSYPDRCTGLSGEHGDPCLIFAPEGGVTDPMRRIAVFGDSHARMMMPGLSDLGDRFEVYDLSTASCPPLLDTYVIAGHHDIGVCRRQAQKQIELVRSKSIGIVFLAARWSFYTTGEYEGEATSNLLSRTASPFGHDIASSRKVFETAIADTVQRYRDAGAHVVFVDQVPQQRINPRHTVEKLFLLSQMDRLDEAVTATSVPVSMDQALQGYAQHELQSLASAMTGVSYLSFDGAFEHDGRYLWMDGGTVLYSDWDHLSGYGAAFLKDRIAEHVNAIVSGGLD